MEGFNICVESKNVNIEKSIHGMKDHQRGKYIMEERTSVINKRKRKESRKHTRLQWKSSKINVNGRRTKCETA